uniref:Uncharacterized protein n=1 Tax=viral metagenome TaxID=1070528 RepID=A0A6M3LPE4_9ZZZZ
MPDYYGDFVQLEPCHWGCSDCGTEIWSIEELRWCPNCQGFIWDDGFEEYRRLAIEAHKLREEANG